MAARCARMLDEPPMSSYQAKIIWTRGDGRFERGHYSRGHTWEFDGGVSVPASASPHNVPAAFAVEAAVDPEEAFVASLSSCHMLSFLHVARKAGWVVHSYQDDAVGTLAEDGEHRLAMTDVVLRPRIVFHGERPSPEQLRVLHHQAHLECFIASSVKTDVRVQAEN
jgi:organic hydroperoxide reductase OsmC/OhrA